METLDEDILFGFAHGIRMTVESLGLPFDGDVMQPVLKRMDTILSNAKHSLVKGDDSVADWDEFRRLRKIEQQLCMEYLQRVIASADNEQATT